MRTDIPADLEKTQASLMEAQAQAAMPRYTCHKKVWALKIAKITPEVMPPFKGALCRGSFALGSACNHCERCDWEQMRMSRGEGSSLGGWIVPSEDGYAGIFVSGDYLRKHNPQVGGYYVVYDDGYKSFSPAKAFEEGYTRL